MAKYYGMIGYADNKETDPGIWEDDIIERPYYGDLLQSFWKFENSGTVNDDINISNRISIVADPYAFNNFHLMRYAYFMGTNWKITNVEVQYPRLILTIGGVYNGPTPKITE